MATLQLISHPEVATVFANYPATVRSQMLALRALVIATAEEIEGLTLLEETLRWGAPSFVTKHGSTLRMDWKAKTCIKATLTYHKVKHLPNLGM